MKTVANVFLFIVFLIIAMGSACKKELTENAPVITYGKDFFPNEIGNEWVYEVYDSMTSKQYDVTIRIVGRTAFTQNVDAKVWTFKYPDKIDTNYVVTDNNVVKIYARDKFERKDTYVLPLVVNATWLGSWIYDKYQVIGRDSISVNKIHFIEAFNIKENAVSHNFIRTKDEWFVPNLGMVKKYRFEYYENKAWKLKSSKLI